MKYNFLQTLDMSELKRDIGKADIASLRELTYGLISFMTDIELGIVGAKELIVAFQRKVEEEI